MQPLDWAIVAGLLDMSIVDVGDPQAPEGTTPDPHEDSQDPKSPDPATQPREIGGPKGPEPTRYGDWEKKGIAVDF
mgnify:CR=1 FL=1